MLFIRTKSTKVAIHKNELAIVDCVMKSRSI